MCAHTHTHPSSTVMGCTNRAQGLQHFHLQPGPCPSQPGKAGSLHGACFIPGSSGQCLSLASFVPEGAEIVLSLSRPHASPAQL